MKCGLHALIVGFADFQGHGEIARFYGGDEPPLAAFQQPSHDVDIVSGQPGHGGDLVVGMTALAHPEYVLQQVHGLMLAARAVLDEACN